MIIIVCEWFWAYLANYIINAIGGLKQSLIYGFFHVVIIIIDGGWWYDGTSIKMLWWILIL